MKNLYIIIIIVLSAIHLSYAQIIVPNDENATDETKALLYNLKEISSQGILFGHQDATAYGINSDGSQWTDEDFRSDVNSVCGDYPAIYGWDLGWIELDSSTNLDNVIFERTKFWIKEAYKRGGINTLSWHSTNPTGGTAWDMGDSPVEKILPGGSLHETYKSWLDKIADFANDLTGEGGEYIPIIFRPFHEHTGDWFWWGSSNCTVSEYKNLWIFTVEYLRDVKEIHHFLYAYSTDRVYTENDYLERYPGDEYIDILGIDNYGDASNISRQEDFLTTVGLVANLAILKNKVSALTETGREGISNDTWWTNVLFNPLKNNNTTKNIAWVLVWRNFSTDHHYAPYPGHNSANNFVEMYNDSFSLFESDLPDMYTADINSVNENITDNSFQLFPNPASRFVHLKSEKQIKAVEIYDIFGKLVLKENLNDSPHNYKLDLSELVNGNYIVKVLQGNLNITERLVIIK